MSLRKVFEVKFHHFVKVSRGRGGGGGGGGTTLTSSSVSLVFFRCWQQNTNMNYWWIIRSPILLAVVVISAALCVCFSFFFSFSSFCRLAKLASWLLCLFPKKPQTEKKSRIYRRTIIQASYNIKRRTFIIHELQKGCRGFQAHMAETT